MHDRMPQARLEQGRLPRPGRRYHHHQAAPGKAFAQSGDQVGCQPVTTEEPLSPRGIECGKAGVRAFIRCASSGRAADAPGSV